ncbi:tripartite tricarboxylate transporter substrate binding protein [Saccharopolyspora sp. K220]|uniref:Bug family tripartite tricarboxylate transporter substrate binding protein n=1 Tax=Saccharopolyspora soli TaxID=2926618 RepID=UPI001F5A6D4F|nr:tripartite tricarboxylate transporter substrate binding protein [Saccharopolyspora soli]MCI2418176.1 tripartite tricarboxylate transporter substrate binding protein [Saccharopolyspora soli]
MLNRAIASGTAKPTKKIAAAAALLAALVLPVACGSGAKSASDYPSDEIRLIVPYTPGGPTDLAARTIGDYFHRSMGQPVVVENMPGAAGSMAMNELVSSKPDGYTMTLVAAPSSVVTPLIQDVGYGPGDFETVGVITEMPSVLSVGPGSRFSTAEQFFAEAKARPQQLKVGVPGATTSQAIELRRLADEYGVPVTVVPFNGNIEMIPALLGGNVDALFSNLSEDVRAQFDAGAFRPLAISPRDRVDYLPQVPTLYELGFQNLTYSTSLFGLGVPKGTPPEIIDELEQTLRAGLQDPQVREQLDEAYVPDQFIDRNAFRAKLDEIVQVYGPVAKRIGGN